MEFIAGRGATGGTGAGSAINVGDSGSGETGNGVVCQWMVELDPSVVQAVELLCLRRLGPIGLIVSRSVFGLLSTPVGGSPGCSWEWIFGSAESGEEL